MLGVRIFTILHFHLSAILNAFAYCIRLALLQNVSIVTLIYYN